MKELPLKTKIVKCTNFNKCGQERYILTKELILSTKSWLCQRCKNEVYLKVAKQYGRDGL